MVFCIIGLRTEPMLNVVTEMDSDDRLGTPLVDYERYTNVGYDAFIFYPNFLTLTR